MDKKSLREQFLHARMGWSAEHLEQISNGIRNNIRANLRDTRTIAMFWPMEHKNEIDLRPLIKELTAEGYTIALPVANTETNTLIFRKFKSEATLAKGKFGLLEPDVSCVEIPYKDIDMVVAPALAVDKQGFRLGYGGGYYDRFLAELKTQNPKVLLAAAVASEFIVSKLPHDALDRPVEMILTEQGRVAIENSRIR